MLIICQERKQYRDQRAIFAKSVDNIEVSVLIIRQEHKQYRDQYAIAWERAQFRGHYVDYSSGV